MSGDGDANRNESSVAPENVAPRIVPVKSAEKINVTFLAPKATEPLIEFVVIVGVRCVPAFPLVMAVRRAAPVASVSGSVGLMLYVPLFGIVVIVGVANTAHIAAIKTRNPAKKINRNFFIK